MCKNKQIPVTNPNGGPWIVILNQKGYISKTGDMHKLGLFEKPNKTAKIEQKLQKSYLNWSIEVS